MKITPREFDLIFGIPFGDNEVDMRNYSTLDSSIGRGKFSQHKKATTTQLRELLEECITRT